MRHIHGYYIWSCGACHSRSHKSDTNHWSDNTSRLLPENDREQVIILMCLMFFIFFVFVFLGCIRCVWLFWCVWCVSVEQSALSSHKMDDVSLEIIRTMRRTTHIVMVFMILFYIYDVIHFICLFLWCVLGCSVLCPARGVLFRRWAIFTSRADVAIRSSSQRL